MKRTFAGLIALFGALGTAAAIDVIAPEFKIDDRVQVLMAEESSAPLPVIVMLKKQANLNSAERISNREKKGELVYKTLTKIAEEEQADLVQWLDAKGLKYQRFYIANMVAVFDASRDDIREMSRRPEVKRIFSNEEQRLLDPRIRDRAPTRDDVTGPGTNIVEVGAAKVWEEFKVKGKGIVVAGQDTGVDWKHPALKSHYVGGARRATHDYSWHDAIREPIGNSGSENKCGYALKEPCDDDQHGTHTMGTVVGDDGNGNAIGMAPESKWMACRNMDSGNGRPTTYIECFQFFLAPHPMDANPFTEGDPEKAPHVINNSWGCPASEGCKGDEMIPVLKSLKAAGIMVVVSAGNEGPFCKTIGAQPATHSFDTFTVGAYNHRTGTIASFSSRGPSSFDGQVGPDVSAPGVSIRSAVPGGGYSETMWSGTSMAGPHVAGLVALMWSAQPKLVGRIDETIALITKTARPKTADKSCGEPTGAVPNNTYGHGLIDAHAAVKAAMSFRR